MSKYKEFKKVLKSTHITNEPNFTFNLDNFLLKNTDIKILHTIVHKPYYVTIIYEVSILIEI